VKRENFKKKTMLVNLAGSSRQKGSCIFTVEAKFSLPTLLKM